MPDRQLVSIFFGGGTPSLMQPETVEALLSAVARNWSVSSNVEITLEANPTSVEAEHFKSFAHAGVNRVSLGIQALEPQDLVFLGRKHTIAEALSALNVSRGTFSRFSFDLIYARPGQSLKAWEAELSQALALAGDHLSLYQLTIEENTAFHTAYHKGAFTLPAEGLAADMYLLTQDIMNAHGLPAYEISNHARKGEESRHNLAYWRGDDYIGIGPGAHGRVTFDGQRIATETIKSPERWLEKVEQNGNGLIAETPLSYREHLEELVMMGLRLNSGIDYADWKTRTGLDVKAALQGKMQRVSDEFIMQDNRHIKFTAKGALLLNRITADLLAA
jgi:oxygen-independent coproporphyrinogen-3 oxidase